MENIWISLLFGAVVFVIVYLVGKVFFEMRFTMESRMYAIERMGERSSTGRETRKQMASRKKSKSFRVGERLVETLESAGLQITPENYLFLWMLSVFTGGILGFWVFRNVILGAVLMGAGIGAPPMYIRMKRARRINLFSAQLGDALMIISNCLRSGLSFRQAMQRVAEDMPEPLRSIFHSGIAKMNYGASLEDVLKEIATDMENRDMELLNAAIGLQQKVGGGLAEIVDTVTATIRERIQIRQQLRTLTAMGRMSGWILGLMPVALLAYFMVSNPEYMGWFFTSLAGNIVLAVAGIWELLGVLIIRKIVNIKL